MKVNNILPSLRQFFISPVSGGVVLILVSVIAIVLVNSGFLEWYKNILHIKVFSIAGILEMDLHAFINDALMAVFFLLVGLEIKREILEGELSEKSQLGLPVIGAIGGVLVPSLIYVFFNYNNQISDVDTMRGWAIPSATDIAFALGVISLLGKKVPLSLKVFLTTLAIIDDVIAILIIAIFYSTNLDILYFGLAALVIIALIMANYFNIYKHSIYLILGLLLWYCFFKSGVHATIAGVILGLIIPLKRDKKGRSILISLEHKLTLWVKFLIIPGFAFFNTGVYILDMNIGMFFNRVTLGIAIGLFVGKQIGVFSFVFLAHKLGLIKKSHNISYGQLYGTAVLTGIGFTMSIFIGDLAFNGDYDIQRCVKLGILSGSILSAIVGYFILYVYGVPQTVHTKAKGLFVDRF